MDFTTITLIYVHAFLGGLGLVSGGLSMVFDKGSLWHRRAGVLFSYSMGLSALTSLIVARMPGHRNDLLFCIGVFTLYLILAGNRALTYKGGRKKQPDLLDYALSTAMSVVALWMLLRFTSGLLGDTEANPLWLIFGGLGLFLGLVDLSGYRKLARSSARWLQMHLGRMIGAYIAAVTAFLIAGMNLEGLLYWVAPTVIGIGYIRFWKRRLQKRDMGQQS